MSMWHQKLSDKVKNVFSIEHHEVDQVEPKAIASQNETGGLVISIQDEEKLSQDKELTDAASDKLPQQEKQEEKHTPPPKMNICILVVGTQGDVQPFIGLGKHLQGDGHRVRLATHGVYRSIVMKHGLEFYPLGGDPKELAAYMVKTGGKLLPTGFDAITKDIPRNMEIIQEILESTWPAVSAPDPESPAHGSFRAHAIISNPVTYGHVHVAEKLGVPLHIMFPQPWVPTKYYPLRNFVSYKAVFGNMC